MEESVFFKDIMRTVKKNLWLIILLAIIGGVAGKFLASKGQPPTYQASAMVLLDKQNDKTALNIVQPDDLNRFYSTAQALINTPAILNPVKSDLRLGMKMDKLSGEISTSIPNTNSQILDITVEDPSAGMATKIANKTAGVFQKEIKNYLSVRTVKIVESAQAGQETKILHSRTKANIAMGVIIGLVIGFVFAFLLDFIRRGKTAA